MKEIKEQSDADFIKKFIEGSPIWYESLMDSLKDRDYCPVCGVPPSNLVRLARILRDSGVPTPTLQE